MIESASWCKKGKAKTTKNAKSCEEATERAIYQLRAQSYFLEYFQQRGQSTLFSPPQSKKGVQQWIKSNKNPYEMM